VDVNGTRVHLLLGEGGWRGPLVEAHGLAWDPERNGLSLPTVPFRFPTPPGSRELGPGDRRGAARDRFGDVFFIGPGADDIRLLAAGAVAARTWWPRAERAVPEPGGFSAKAPPVPPPPAQLSGLAVTDHHYLLAGQPSLPGLLAFDLHGGGPPVPVRWPPLAGGFVPVDLAPSPWGGAWILDRPPPPTRTRIWLVDRFLRVVDLGRGAGGPRISPDQWIELEAAFPVSVEGLPDGSVLVLDREAASGSTVLRFRDGAPAAFSFSAGELTEAAHDLAFLPAVGAGDSAAGRLLVADAAGNQAFAFAVSAAGDQATPTGDYFPMRMFSGKGIVAGGGSAFYDMGERWLALLDRRQRRHERDGFLVAGPFDGKEPGCVWHRMLLDGCIPPGTEVAVESRAADTPELLAGRPWQVEPAPYRRADGPELPAWRPFPPGSPAGAGTWELLFQDAAGRHLQLRLSLRGDGRRTPRLNVLRLYYPRFSYLRQYLPDIYQEDAHSASFLGRYLANLEGVSTALEGRIESAQTLFDVAATDAEFLPWLASWLGAVLDPEWEEARSRLFLRYAVELFRQRGTRDGLLRAIRLATDPCPDDQIFDRQGVAGQPFGVRIVERYLTRTAPGVVFGDPTEASGPREVTPGARWTPADGAEQLHAAWRAFLGEPPGSEARFPAQLPDSPGLALDWRRFVRSRLAVGYDDVGPGDAGAFRAFLAQRYRRIDDLNDAWGLAGASRAGAFAELELPTEVPGQAVALRDWIQFVSIVLPTARRAHRFSVLVPVRPEDSDADRAFRVGRVERVVRAHKPTHTAYDLRTYFAAFRVGEARAGLETIVGEGSRFVAIVLGRSRLAESYASGAAPWDVADRMVVGRDRVAPAGGEATGRKGDCR
jgi:phage tail-like protein